MKKTKKATSIAEAMVVLLIVVVGLTGVYSIFSESVKLTDSVENKIQAIQIAREGLEAVTNIRDTNWILYSSNTQSCWKTLNYNSDCLTGTPVIIGNNVSYRVDKDSDNKWLLLNGTISPNEYSNVAYRDFYRIYLDGDGLYTHDITGSELKNIFTREIQTRYIDADTGIPDSLANNGLEVKSIVRWVDSSGRNAGLVHEIILETILTNYKK